ncbi:aldehyde dehydrogenase (NAD+) [Streptomyces africanus]|uniref:Aldehyde dehydrogenase (NAD+) n=1 Tax=Streptomyces africanus TaxID=231024 RepID=A0ABU0R2W1_9ACTN|nr:aldehyde dehydrogenase [Streptomyces africanus]MDQ0753996.1 aldehyde dehydrogenase (NAD+) [Streptomyces africanus]
MSSHVTIQAPALVRDRLFIGGDMVESEADDLIEVISPATEEKIGSAPSSTPADVSRAVRAARAAFDDGPWPRMSPQERADALKPFTDYLRSRVPQIAQLITEEMGSPISFSQHLQAPIPVMLLDYFRGLATTFPFEEDRAGLTGPARILREPVGVVGQIVPWNAPLILTMVNLAPALVAGCTVVLKPAPETPLDAYLLAEAAMEAHLPPGVLNIVPADRPSSEALVRHPQVDKISFTGSSATGRRVAALCGEQFKRVTLECGGKSPAIILEDADLDSVVPALMPFAIMMSGQHCLAQTRILAHRSRYRQVVDAVSEAAAALTVGDPHDPATEVGPLVAERQRRRVEDYIASGRQEGATINLGGGRPSSQPKGWYVEPTVFADVDSRMRIAQDEIFGPVLVVIPFDDDTDAVRIANDSKYGLSGSVWSSDEDRAMRIARHIRTGSLTINGYRIEFAAPFGGYKESGIGREFGPEGLSSFLEYKTVNLPNATTH